MKQVDLFTKATRDRLPPTWTREYGPYRFFYAPGVYSYATNELGENASSLLEKAKAFGDEISGMVPPEWKRDIPQSNAAWKLGSDPVRFALRESNASFSKCVLILTLLHRLRADACEAQGRKLPFVFDLVKLRAAIFQLPEEPLTFLREEVLPNSKRLDALKIATGQHNDVFFQDMLAGRQATYETLCAIREHLEAEYGVERRETIKSPRKMGGRKPARGEIMVSEI